MIRGINARCDECGEPVKTHVVDFEEASYIAVEPCRQCMGDAYEEGFADADHCCDC